MEGITPVSPEQRKQIMADEMLPVLYNGYGRKTMPGAVQPLASDQKGFVATLDDPAMLYFYQKLMVEYDRQNVLYDCRTILTEAGYIDSMAHSFVTWATAERPRLVFNGKSKARAEQIASDMLERTKYWQNRPSYLYNAIYLELFLKKEVNWNPEFTGMLQDNPLGMLDYVQKGGKVGSLDGLLGPMPAETMFRHSDQQDRFADPPKSFCQIPEPYNRSLSQTEVPFNVPGVPAEWFDFRMMMHPRWNHLCNKVIRYSRPALMPIRKAYNRVELGGTDAAIQRHLASSRIINYALNANLDASDREASSVRIEEMRRTLKNLYPAGVKAGTMHVSSGADKIDVLSSVDLQLSKPEDLYYHLDLVNISMLMPPQLLGYTGGQGKNINGPMLEQLRRTLEINITLANNWERDNLLLEIIYFELFLNGIYDVEVLAKYDAPASDNKAVRKKIEQGEVQNSQMSRQTYYERNYPDGDWQEEMSRIEAETKRLGDVKRTQLDQSALDPNKGNSGDPRPPEKQVPKPDKVTA